MATYRFAQDPRRRPAHRVPGRRALRSRPSHRPVHRRRRHRPRHLARVGARVRRRRREGLRRRAQDRAGWRSTPARRPYAHDRRVAARRDARGAPGVPRLHQGPAVDPGRRRHPVAERRAAPGARPVRLHPPGALLRGRRRAGEGAGEAQHRHLPREHGGRLRRHRVEGGLAGGRGARAASSATKFGKRSARARRIGIKPMSEFGSKRLVQMAIEYALEERARES